MTTVRDTKRTVMMGSRCQPCCQEKALFDVHRSMLSESEVRSFVFNGIRAELIEVLVSKKKP